MQIVSKTICMKRQSFFVLKTKLRKLKIKMSSGEISPRLLNVNVSNQNGNVLDKQISNRAFRRSILHNNAMKAEN